MKIKVELPIKVSTNSIYSGKKWKVRAQEKEMFLNEFWIHKGKIKDITEYPVDLEFEFYLTGRGFDSSNCSYRGKMLEDCLVAIGVLVDDTTKYVKSVKYESIKNNGKIDYVIITIKKGEN